MLVFFFVFGIRRIWVATGQLNGLTHDFQTRLKLSC